MLNKVMLIGRLGADPEMHYGKNDKPFATFRIATSEKWGKGEDRQERTEWHSVVVFSEPTANYVTQYAEKGTLLYIEGKLQTRKWQDQNGNDRYSTEVVVSGFNTTLQILSDSVKSESGNRGNRRQGYREKSKGGEPDDLPPLDDEIPF